jgi:hypothetical protein
MAKNAAKPTIYEYAGGAPAFLRLTQAFYVKVKADPELQPASRTLRTSTPTGSLSGWERCSAAHKLTPSSVADT